MASCHPVTEFDAAALSGMRRANNHVFPAPESLDDWSWKWQVGANVWLVLPGVRAQLEANPALQCRAVAMCNAAVCAAVPGAVADGTRTNKVIDGGEPAGEDGQTVWAGIQGHRSGQEETKFVGTAFVHGQGLKRGKLCVAPRGGLAVRHEVAHPTSLWRSGSSSDDSGAILIPGGRMRTVVSHALISAMSIRLNVSASGVLQKSRSHPPSTSSQNDSPPSTSLRREHKSSAALLAHAQQVQ